MKFKVGMKVEACSWEHGFEGAWFEGVIRSCKRDYCEVLFEKFKGEDGDHRLVEKTNYDQLRPRPPRTNIRNWATGDLLEAYENVAWAIGDLVEAYENDAWWRGVVMQVLPAQQYYVEFPETKSYNIFHQSNIRVRQDWRNGTWYLPSPSPLQATGPKNFPAKFPVAKGLLYIDNKACSLSIDGSNTAFVHSSPERKMNMQVQKDKIGHATEKRSTHDHLADEITHRLEVNAYRSVLQVFSTRKTLSWKTELLLTDLRDELHITSQEHLLELQKLNLAC